MRATLANLRDETLEWLVLVFLLALLPRLFALGARPFWLDEIFTLQRVQLSPAALVLDSFQNHHMPSFFLLLWPLMHLGHPEYWLRLPSAICGALAVMLVFLIARRIAGRLSAILAALILGLSPTILAFSQEARSYMLVMTLILVALYGLVRLAQDLPCAAKPMRDPAARLGWLCFILGTAAVLDVLGDGLPWLLTANLIALALAGLTPDRRGLLLNMLKADAIILLLTAPFYALLLHYEVKSFVETLAWVPPLDSKRLWYSLGSVYFMHLADSVTFNLIPGPRLPIIIIDACLGLAVATAAWRLRRAPAMLTVLGISVLFLPCMLTLISFWQPVLVPRYILWSAAPFAILAGIGAACLLENLSARWRLLAISATATLLLVNLLPYYQAETKPRWDIAAKILAQDVAPGDVVYLHDFYANKLLQTYLPADKQALMLNDSNSDIQHAAQAKTQGKRVWAVYGLAGQGSGATERQDYNDNQKLFGHPSKILNAGSRIVIALYDPNSQGGN